jgi:hypothetical protein
MRNRKAVSKTESLKPPVAQFPLTCGIESVLGKYIMLSFMINIQMLFFIHALPRMFIKLCSTDIPVVECYESVDVFCFRLSIRYEITTRLFCLSNKRGKDIPAVQRLLQ